MLLTNLKVCRIGEREEVGEKVSNAVGKDIREDVISFDREATSAQDIGFRGVVNRKINEIDEIGEINEIGEVGEVDKIGEVDEVDKIGEVSEVDFFTW